MVRRAAEHEPIAYLTGRAHFFNLELEIEPGVLIPRPDTETLVENVLQLARNTAGFEAPRVIDLCTGSGCIAAAIASRLKGAIVIATDVSDQAVGVVRKNLERLKLNDRVTVAQGDLFEPLKEMVDVRPFDLIVANPPYIPTEAIAELDRNVRDFEPIAALDGGMDGLMIHRRIVEESPQRPAPGDASTSRSSSIRARRCAKCSRITPNSRTFKCSGITGEIRGWPPHGGDRSAGATPIPA